MEKVGPHIYTGTVADMINIAQDTQREMEKMSEWQRTLKEGDHCFRLWDIDDDPTRPRFATLYYEVIPCEYEEDKWLLDKSIFVNGYSILCPEGELGTTPRAFVTGKLLPGMFELARVAYWESILQHSNWIDWSVYKE